MQLGLAVDIRVAISKQKALELRVGINGGHVDDRIIYIETGKFSEGVES